MDTPPPFRPGDEIVLPLFGEQVSVTKRVVETGRVRAQITTHLRDHLVTEELGHERVEVEHVAIGRIVAEMPVVRVEGDTTILPVVEEIVVVERRLLLKEEVHVRRVHTTTCHSETVSLREQQAEITRTPLVRAAG